MRSNTHRNPSMPVVLAALLLAPALAFAQASDPLPSWHDGPTKTAILEFVKATTEEAGPKFVPPEARIATFDQDGTTWVEQPLYTQVMYCFERVPVLAETKPELKDVEPYKTVLSGDKEAIAKLPKKALEEILVATLTGMTVDEFTADVEPWMEKAKHPRFKRLYSELTYLPMLEVMRLFRDNGYKTYFVTGGGQDFVRVYSEATYGIPPEQVVGSAGDVKFGYDKSGKPILTRSPSCCSTTIRPASPKEYISSLGDARWPRLATPSATSRCWNIRRAETEHASWFSCITTMQSASTRMARIRKSERFPMP